MRYTTPEWLLENLETRLRIALEQSSARENHIPGTANSSKFVPSETTSNSALQSAA